MYFGKNKSFKMYDEKGDVITFEDILKDAENICKDTTVFVKISDKQKVPIRVCAIKKMKEHWNKQRKNCIENKVGSKQNILTVQNLYLSFSL